MVITQHYCAVYLLSYTSHYLIQINTPTLIILLFEAEKIITGVIINKLSQLSLLYSNHDFIKAETDKI